MMNIFGVGEEATTSDAYCSRFDSGGDNIEMSYVMAGSDVYMYKSFTGDKRCT